MQKNYAQVPVGIFNETNRGYFQTLEALAGYLKKERTPTISLHETETYSSEEAFYDKVISEFFEKDKLLKSFEKDTIVFSVKGKVDIIRHILKGCDQTLDTVSADSILIEPFDEKDSLIQSAAARNLLNVFLLKGGKKLHMLTWYFDERTNKIAGVSFAGSENGPKN